MREKIHFQQRSQEDDGYGNQTSGPYRTIFSEPAELIPGTGSETVIAARLAGTQPYTIIVRSSSRTRQIDTSWQAVDARDASRVFDITAVSNPDRWNGKLNIQATEK